MAERAPRVSVIIPVYDDYDGLERCLECLERQTLGRDDWELLVVDNNTPASRFRDLSDQRGLRQLHEAATGSYAARNRGIAEARGEILAFTDADCLPEPDWLEEGVRALEALGEPGYVAGAIELFAATPEHPTMAEAWELALGFPQERYVAELSFGATANVVVHREVVDAVGGFDLSFLSGGDRDFGERVGAAGFPLSYSDATRVRHPARRSMAALLKKTRRTTRGDVQRMERAGELLGGRRLARLGEAGWHLLTPLPKGLMYFVLAEGSPAQRASLATAQVAVRLTKEWVLARELIRWQKARRR